jgi:amino acid adenylation domain-containing protein
MADVTHVGKLNLQCVGNRIPTAQQLIKEMYCHPSGTWVEFTQAEVGQTVSRRFEKQVEKYPDRLAVESDAHQLSYLQLNQQANCIAHALEGQKSEAGNRKSVGILLNNDAPMLAAMLGILKTGRPYVPLDPSFPQERLAYYLSDSGADLILTDDGHRDLANELAAEGIHVLNIDALDSSLPTHNPEILVTPDAIAHIYYTSGSTGKPKSVYNDHRSLLHRIRRNTNDFTICPEDRLICLKSFGFSGALKDVFGTLLNGASLHLYPLKQKGIASLGGWLVERRITVYNSVATVFRQLVSGLKPDMRFPDLRIVYIGGEQIKPSDIEAYREYFAPHGALCVGLGSTETGAVTHLYIDKYTQLTDGVMPIGYPTDEVEVLILGESGEKLGANAEGQIAVKSRYLVLGYWNNDELTQEKFLPGEDDATAKIYLTGDMGYLDETGCLYCVGREDFQVKIRGYRVGLEEIEQHLLKHPEIQAGVVLAKTQDSGEQYLVAYYVPTEQNTLTVTALRRFLEDKLPDYMIPSVFVELDSLPVTQYGKLDVKALSDPERSRPNLETPYAAPQTPEEEKLATIWAKILGIDQVGIHDDFFELGGQSIAMMQLLTEVEGELEVEVPVPAFLEAPSIASLAMLIQE